MEGSEGEGPALLVQFLDTPLLAPKPLVSRKLSVSRIDTVGSVGERSSTDRLFHTAGPHA